MPPKAKTHEPTPPFQFTHDGDTFEIPAINEVKAGVMRRVSGMNLGPVGMTWALLEQIATPEAIAALEDKPTREFDELCNEWMKHSGVVLGEF